MSADYHYPHLTERECRAIRMNYGAMPIYVERNERDMTMRLKDREGYLEIPERDCQDFIAAWKATGRWSLHGHDYPSASRPERADA